MMKSLPRPARVRQSAMQSQTDLSRRARLWIAYIRTHLALFAGTDFFTVEVLTWRGLATYYVLFFIHLESRRVDIAGITDHPKEQWMQQMARNATMEGCGALRYRRYLLHDRDTKYSAAFRAKRATSERYLYRLEVQT
jgi:hypothetical protein